MVCQSHRKNYASFDGTVLVDNLAGSPVTIKRLFARETSGMVSKVGSSYFFGCLSSRPQPVWVPLGFLQVRIGT
jgi:hypothetical protein